MSRHPSPHLNIIPLFQSTPPQPLISMPLRQKSKAYTTGIAAGAEDVKYQAKYKELKRKVKEIEADNDKLHFKVLQTKRSIQRMKLEQAILYERLSAGLPPSDAQDRNAPPLMHTGPGIQPPPQHMYPHSHQYPHQHQQHSQHSYNPHNQHLSHRDSREHTHGPPLSHPHPSAHVPPQGDTNDFLDFMRANNNPGGGGGPVHIMTGTDGRSIPASEIVPGIPVHPSRSNSSSAGGNGTATPVAVSSASTTTPHDATLQLPPLPPHLQHFDLTREHMLAQERVRMGIVAPRGRPEVVYGPIGPPPPQQQPQPYAPEAHLPIQHVAPNPSLPGPRDRTRRHDSHEMSGEYGPIPTHGGAGGAMRMHNHQRVGPGAYITRGDEHIPHPPHTQGHGHGHGHPNEWERVREYGPPGPKADTPPGVPYRGGERRIEQVELRWNNQEQQQQQQQGAIVSRSGTPGSVIGDGMNRGEPVYDRGRFGVQPMNEPRDVDIDGEEEEEHRTGHGEEPVESGSGRRETSASTVTSIPIPTGVPGLVQEGIDEVDSRKRKRSGSESDDVDEEDKEEQ